MTVLAIDTSNYALGVALLEDHQVLGEYITNLKKNHSIRVMPAIQMLMRDCEKTPADLRKIVVAKGPGSYTGVRIGVTIAKTLAWTLNIPLVGISSLEILAAGTGRYFDGYISPIFDARRGQVYTGLYQFEGGRLEVVKEDQLAMLVDWSTKLMECSLPILFVGNDLSIHQNKIAEILGPKAKFASITEHNPRPSELALLGKDKPGEDVHSFVPNYIRLAEAEAKWLEANGKTLNG
ncbi:tRNA (adenosine(37)-N6)-threonylcarbamoyltransferase complex dimerization subunit type 1 TsaB [Neobacillus thermocopriae]|uniref:tRNA (Adenosine(37)-N6)-threonylcarbamoyltransferase complex dimerization subunit type 1 TsaB n=1 Tax=Neobacillus thermocopriae TaxID=1215031 RepID=A0A6B3TVY6_9BACI|nr:tRNA (adenosine(37)-N6)-threonylcarbamoyltransferase complex dimerization subunit type 1 TsaB [Neobacillus thermocopriae]MED3623217.1 tRNA (adenosine(37)-N6)-threonylcarbamoyltransferase complex dimerization subunit type 1 TsaB [Neobacillus thermocopriae]MED3714421.1 tRNA (adenosine(37)-N6)-threonylcarbamoyltransferase complex dimerization subunit type 1 TsaB [Neobacillus thermocopriae]NEX80121.1 tRNA (adenosine(37)-N6)-threonylcarbamoyltransferase complex dimerization subunit type 1 TsaB [Ne